MGHEISHALREHGRARASQHMAAGISASLLGIVADIFLPGCGQLATGGAELGTQVGVLLPYSRVHETEADRMGVELAARAGYDPRAAIALWQKMAKLSARRRSCAPPIPRTKRVSRTSRSSRGRSSRCTRKRGARRSAGPTLLALLGGNASR